MTDTSTKATCQKAAILAHLRQHGYIDSKTSRNLYGCEALRSRIADLRKAGVEIETLLQMDKRKQKPRRAYFRGVRAAFVRKEIQRGCV